jgi:hypothetical protein
VADGVGIGALFGMGVANQENRMHASDFNRGTADCQRGASELGRFRSIFVAPPLRLNASGACHGGAGQQGGVAENRP